MFSPPAVSRPRFSLMLAEGLSCEPWTVAVSVTPLFSSLGTLSLTPGGCPVSGLLHLFAFLKSSLLDAMLRAGGLQASGFTPVQVCYQSPGIHQVDMKRICSAQPLWLLAPDI